MKSCFFIGHRDSPESLLAHLTILLERLIVEENVGHFYVGQYGNFDRMAALAVKQLKKQYPYITLNLVIPYHPAERPISAPPGFDGTYYPWEDEKIPKRLAIIKTNQHMVDTCDYLITYAFHFHGGTGQIVEYARKRESKGLIQITNLAQNKPSHL